MLGPPPRFDVSERAFRHFALAASRGRPHATALSLLLHGDHEALTLAWADMPAVNGGPSVTVRQQKVVLILAHFLVRVPHVVHAGLHNFLDIASRACLRRAL